MLFFSILCTAARVRKMPQRRVKPQNCKAILIGKVLTLPFVVQACPDRNASFTLHSVNAFRPYTAIQKGFYHVDSRQLERL